MSKKPARIDWGRITRSTTGSSRRLIESLDEVDSTPKTVSRGDVVLISGLKVRVDSITRQGPDVTISGKVLRQVRRP